MLKQDIESASERMKALASRPRWMLVDDTPAVLEAVAMLLEALDCAEVCKFYSPEEALEAFAADPKGFELVMTDFDMPGMTGLELCKAVREITPNQKVILATGSLEITEAEALPAGFCGMLKKPFPFRELMACLEREGLFRSRENQTGAEGIGMISEAWALA